MSLLQRYIGHQWSYRLLKDAAAVPRNPGRPRRRIGTDLRPLTFDVGKRIERFVRTMSCKALHIGNRECACIELSESNTMFVRERERERERERIIVDIAAYYQETRDHRQRKGRIHPCAGPVFV